MRNHTDPLTLSSMRSVTWHVGDVVRKLRQARGWTQKDLARRAKLHHNTIVRLEDGDEGVRARTLKAIADALAVSVRDLWRMVPSDRDDPPSELDQRFSALTREGQEILLAALTSAESATVDRRIEQPIEKAKKKTAS